jgi:hypothetical protein
MIVMAQRLSRADYARRSYQRLLSLNMEPDVFTITALIDVVGRQESLASALEIFTTMLTHSELVPNIVTFATLLRLAGMCIHDINEGLCSIFYLLDTAASLKNLYTNDIAASIVHDVSLYNCAMAACVKLQASSDSIVIILSQMQTYNIEYTELTYRILAKYCILHTSRNNNNDDVVSLPETVSAVLSDEAKSHVLTAISTRLTNDKQHVVITKPIYEGVLGPEAPMSLRQAVMTHDVSKLLDRIDVRLGGDPR